MIVGATRVHCCRCWYGASSAVSIGPSLSEEPPWRVGHVWTVPAVQEEFDYQRSVRVRSCIRPIVAWRVTSVTMQPLWPLALM